MKRLITIYAEIFGELFWALDKFLLVFFAWAGVVTRPTGRKAEEALAARGWLPSETAWLDAIRKRARGGY